MGKRLQKVLLVVIALMAVLVMVFLFRMEGRLSSMKVMRHQLQSLRTSVRLFRAVEGRSPRDMKELVGGEFSYPDDDERRRFVDVSLMDACGLALDPFGNPYALDPKSGWVTSTTPGYEYW